MPLFESRTARVTVTQSDQELTGPKSRHGYDFSIPCVAGEISVQFTNITGDPVDAVLVNSAIDDTPTVPVAAGESHTFTLNVTENVDPSLIWGDRSAILRFRVATS